MEQPDTVDIFRRLAEAVEIETAGIALENNRESAQAKIRKVARQFLRSELNKRPMIIPVILDT